MADNIPVRLPMPQGISDLDAGKWRVLVDSIFPTAKTAGAVMLALDYCKARKLDVFKKPVNIVPMWSSAANAMVETVWPGINSVQIDAARSNSWAGMDEPKYGPDVTKTFKGKLRNNVGDTEITVTFPEWCSVTVYRIVQGQRYAFTEPVYWLEAYARREKTELPNEMWAKRPRGQFLKVAKAFSLRAAFPEDADYTSEEMEGRTIEEMDTHNGVIIENESPKVKSLFKTHAARNHYCESVAASLEGCINTAELVATYLGHVDKLDKMKKGHEYDADAAQQVEDHYVRLLERFKHHDTVATSFGPGFADVDALVEAEVIFESPYERKKFVDNVKKSYTEAKTVSELEELAELNDEKLLKMAEGQDEDVKAAEDIASHYTASVKRLAPPVETKPISKIPFKRVQTKEEEIPDDRWAD